jgi:16S rRNA (cytosine1402-N4)-methyltransferase
MNNRDQHPHKPVLLEETVSALITDKSGIYIDCTIGFGGHSFEILQRINKKGKLFGIDYDPYALEYSKNRLSELERYHELFLSNYTGLKSLIKTKNIKKVNGILFDLGISSYQVDSGYKGLSYRIDSPLDMRLDPNSDKNINDILKNLNDNELANLIYNNSEEKNSRKIAKSINIKYRDGSLKTNSDLVEAIQMVTPKRFLNKTLSRVFQAFRIVINNEFKNIFKSVVDAIEVLKPGGRLAVITFHSIEDRLIKNIFKSFARGDKSYLENIGYNLTVKCEKTIKILTKKPISPNRDEILANKRSRSAKLRIIERLIIV